MSVIFLRCYATSPSRINSAERDRHGQYPVFGPIFRGGGSNFCSQFRNRVRHRYSRGMPHYCLPRTPHRDPRGAFGKHHRGERVARAAENTRRQSASAGNAYPFDYSSPSWIIQASRERANRICNYYQTNRLTSQRWCIAKWPLITAFYGVFTKGIRDSTGWNMYDHQMRYVRRMTRRFSWRPGRRRRRRRVDDIVGRRSGIREGRVVTSRRRAEIAVESGRGERSE